MAMPYYKSVRPIIAAHRGLSSLYPENTLEGFVASLQYADFIELDVVLNKDKELIVCHDSYLSLVSDIRNKIHFEGRKTTRMLYGKEKNDWWVNDFSLKELKELNLFQCINNRKSEYDGKLQIPTLREVISTMIKYNVQNNTKKGILLEIKDYEYHETYSKVNIAEPTMQVLKELCLGTEKECAEKLPIVIMAFDQLILNYFHWHCNLPLASLVWFEDKVIPKISEIQQYSQIIGLDMRLVWENNQTTEYYEEAKRNGLVIYGWTFQDDMKDIPNIFKEQCYGKIYERCSTLLQGIITEFPQEAIKYIL